MSQFAAKTGLLIAMLIAMLSPSCSSMAWTATHHGVRYSIHRDKHTHKIVKGKDGSLMYDSPELVVLCENGRLLINGQECGAVTDGDLVEITELGTVLVNGARRGDKLTGHAEMQQRLKDSKQFMQTHSKKELEYKSQKG